MDEVKRAIAKKIDKLINDSQNVHQQSTKDEEGLSANTMF
jgi:hypothetical protein